MNPRTSSNLKRCIFFFLPLTACKNHRVLHGRLARHVWREDSGNEEPFLTHPHIRIAVMQSTTACGRFRYHTNALIGRGGEGDVYSGIDLVSQRPMAIKVLKRATVGSLPPELAVLSDLTSHKHIVPAPIHAMCARTRRSILVSPLYLSDLHTAVECEPLSEVHVRGIMHQLLSALHHMHEAGVCHRDVKLENIFVRAEKGGHFDVVLGDFGLARAGLRGGSKAVGTKEFMAPEMVNPGCEGYDTAAADVWAAGVVGIMCLTHIGVGWHRGEVVFPSAPQLKGLSESGWSFFRSLFTYDPVYRPTAGTLLTHPWFAEEEEREKMKGEDALPRIKADGFAPVLIADDGAITP